MKDEVSVFDLPDHEFRRVIVDKINQLILREQKLRQRVEELESKVASMDEVDAGEIRDEVLQVIRREE
jgi:hypothetical protein